MQANYEKKPDGDRVFKIVLDNSVDRAFAGWLRLPVWLVMIAVLLLVWWLTGHWLPTL